MTARHAALTALYEIEYNGAYSNIALKDVLAKADLSSRDSALATALVYGTLSNKRLLDSMIESLSSIKLKKLSKYILLIVRMGIYQLKFMDKIPASAAVNESVKLAKRYGHKASAGYVNGILHRAAETDFEPPEDVAVRLSFSDENAVRLMNDYPDCAEEIMSALNGKPRLTVRVNRLRTTREKLLGIEGMEEVADFSDALYCRNVDIAKSREYADGLFTVQDIAPMLACRVLDAKKGETVIDLCAAPGGKTTYIAEMMQNEGVIKAFDLHSHRVDLIDKNAKRLGIDIINTAPLDATVFQTRLADTADKVLADVPCSGIGIARRKPELKFRADAENLPPIQLAILENGAKYLKKGGEIVYSTCTLFEDENERVIEKFLENNKDFELVSFSEHLPEGLSEEREGMMTILPNEADMDGFFIAKLRKVSK